MNRCAFLSMDSLEDFECYDALLIEPFNSIGWQVDTVSWRNERVDWGAYDVVIIRSCWDYQQAPGQFLQVLHNIDKSSAFLVNELNLVKWNINKKYLKDLKSQGIKIIPTLWPDEFSTDAVASYFSHFNTDKIILKPTVGAGADDTFCVSKTDIDEYTSRLKNVFKEQAFLVQPFIENVLDEGEYSLFYFGDDYSHTILKTPKTGDFRVQEEHGGRLQTVKADVRLRQNAQKVLRALPGDPLYARIDFLRNKEEVLLIEVELIEPSLYFNMDADSAGRFTQAFDKWWSIRKKVGV